jgi:hypothetical protein
MWLSGHALVFFCHTRVTFLTEPLLFGGAWFKGACRDAVHKECMVWFVTSFKDGRYFDTTIHCVLVPHSMNVLHANLPYISLVTEWNTNSAQVYGWKSAETICSIRNDVKRAFWRCSGLPSLVQDNIKGGKFETSWTAMTSSTWTYSITA